LFLVLVIALISRSAAGPVKGARPRSRRGPLQASGLAGSLTWALKAAPNGTTVELSYSVGGFFPGGFERIAPAVSAVLEEQLQRVTRFVETGKPA
jgi:hypothetical protein